MLVAFGLCGCSSVRKDPLRGEISGNVQIVGHHWTLPASVMLPTGPQAKTVLFLDLKANLPEPHRVDAADFLVAYRHDGRKVVEKCVAIGPDDPVSRWWRFGPDAALDLGQGPLHFALGCEVETGVEEITLHPPGGSSVSYRVGRDRPHSVYIVTTQDGAAARARRVIEAAGHQVAGTAVLESETLECAQVTLNVFGPQAVAADIAQRLAANSGVAPAVVQQPEPSIADIFVVVGGRLPACPDKVARQTQATPRGGP